MTEQGEAEALPEFESGEAQGQGSGGAGDKKGSGRRRLILLGGGGLLFFCICLIGLAALTGGDDGDVETVEEPAEEVVAVEETTGAEAEQEEEPEPSETPTEPTNTPEPTTTPAPTDTPAPTSTPEPTETPAPTETPTPLPEPIVLSGTGDSIVDVEKGPEPALVQIEGNAASRHFAVTSLGEGNEQLNLLVNTTEPYAGMRPLDFLEGEHTVRFEVTGEGDWTIEILPLGAIEVVSIPGEISGNGDYVFAVEGNPDTAQISGNAAGRHFAVRGYGSGFPDLLVNTTDPYDGRVLLSADTLILEVTGVGEWTVVFE